MIIFDAQTSSNSSPLILLFLLFIEGINGGELVFVVGENDDKLVGYFGEDLVGFCEGRDGEIGAPISLPPI